MHSKTKKIPNKARYERARNMAYNFILEQGITSLPVDPLELVAKNGWTIKSMTQFSEYGFSIPVIQRDIMKSNDGSTEYCADTNEYHILYNEKIGSSGRIRWTIMHEIAHIALTHFIDFPETRLSRGGISPKEYDVLEKEADFFTAYVLAPPIVLYELGMKSASQIQNICKLSKAASENRFNHLNNWNPWGYVDRSAIRVMLNFYDFIHRKHCPNCDYDFVYKEAVFCPICRKKVKWGKGSGTMIYDGYELDENGYPSVCPRCENEEIDKEGNHCKICGVPIVNKCTGTVYDRQADESYECGTIASGNARYCIKCGEITTYFEHELLERWQDEKRQKEDRE